MANPVPVGLAVGALLPMAAALLGAHSVVPRTGIDATVGIAQPTSGSRPASRNAVPIVLEEIGRLGLGGPSRAVALQAQYAYVGLGSRLEVLDVSDAARPRMVGRMVTEDDVAAVGVDGEVGYVAEASGRFTVLDLSEPSDPRPIGLIEGVGWSPQQLAVDGSHVYAAADGSGLAIFDVSVRSEPELVKFVNTVDRALGVTVGGDYAYVADNDGGLRIIDIEEPRLSSDIGAASDVAGMVRAVAHRGGYVYAATVEFTPWPSVRLDLNPDRSGQSPNQMAAWPDRDDQPMPPVPTETRVLVLDVSDATRPQVVGSAEAGSATNEWLTALAVTDTHAYVGSNSYFPGGASGQIFIFDITDPSKLRSVGVANHRGVAVDLAIGDGRILAATGYGGLETIDVSHVSAPRQVGRYGSPTTPKSVAAAGRLAYVADSGYGGSHGDGRLFVLEASDPALINPVGQAIAGSLMDPLCTAACQVAASGNLAVVADAIHWLYTFDVSNPGRPEVRGRIGGHVNRAGPARIAVDGAHAYAAAVSVGTRVGGFYVIDTANPAEPRVVGAVEGLEAHDVAVAGSTAFVAVEGSLQLYDVLDPAHPRLLRQVDMPFLTTRVAAASSFAYAASSAGFLHVVDVAAAGGPRLIAQLQMGQANADLHDLLIAGDILYAVHARGVIAVDVTDPARPEIVGRWSAPEGNVLSGALSEGDLFIVHANVGHIVLRPSDGPWPTATPTPQPTPHHTSLVFIPWASGG